MRLFALVALALGAWSAPAFACSYDPCGPAVRTFGENARVPGNLVFFRVEKDDATLALVTADGTPIPASVRTINGDKVFAPEQPIAANQRVRVRWSYKCTQSGWDLEDEYTFKTTEPVAPLTGHAELELLEAGLRPWSNTHRRETDWREGFADVLPGWSNDDELIGAYSHLFDVRYEVDGKVVWKSGLALVVRTPCERAAAGNGSSCGDFDEFPAGPHTVSAIGHIIGTGVSLNASLEVNTSCNGAPPPACSVAPGALGVPRDDVKDAAPPRTDQVIEEDVTPKEDGCRLARGRFDAAYLALGLALLLRRKRA